MTVNDETIKLVRERANYLCEYCHSLEEASAAQFANEGSIIKARRLSVRGGWHPPDEDPRR